MRIPQVLTLVALLAVPGLAFAGKAKEADPLPTIEMTGIGEFDSVFKQAKDIQDKLKGETENLKGARTNVNTTLGVATDAPLETALADLQAKAEKKVSVAMEGGTPKLNADAALPDNVKGGVDAVNKLIDAAKSTIGTAGGLKTDAAQLASACSAFPGKLPGLVSNPLEIAKKMKVVGDDVKATAALPDRLQLLVDEATKIVSDVQTAFGG